MRNTYNRKYYHKYRKRFWNVVQFLAKFINRRNYVLAFEISREYLYIEVMYSDFIRDFICVQGTHVVDTQGADPSQRGAAQRGLVPRFQPDKFSFLGGALGRARLARQRTVKDDFFEPFRCFKSLLSSSGEGRVGERPGRVLPNPRRNSSNLICYYSVCNFNRSGLFGYLCSSSRLKRLDKYWKKI